MLIIIMAIMIIFVFEKSGWVGGCKNRLKGCLQQSNIMLITSSYLYSRRKNCIPKDWKFIKINFLFLFTLALKCAFCTTMVLTEVQNKNKNLIIVF